MSIIVTGVAEVNSQLKQIANKIGMDSTALTLQLGKNITTNLARATEPIGITNKAKKVSENAVSSDISKSVKTYWEISNKLKKINPRAAAIFLKYINAGNISGAKRIADKYIPVDKLTDEFIVSEHANNRGRRGRVSRNVKSDATRDQSGITSFRDKAIKVIGLAKAAWLQAGNDIKSTKPMSIPTWLRQTPGLGRAIVVKTINGVTITLVNNVSYAGNILTSAKMNKAVTSGYKNTLKQLQKMLDSKTLK